MKRFFIYLLGVVISSAISFAQGNREKCVVINYTNVESTERLHLKSELKNVKCELFFNGEKEYYLFTADKNITISFDFGGFSSSTDKNVTILSEENQNENFWMVYTDKYGKTQMANDKSNSFLSFSKREMKILRNRNDLSTVISDSFMVGDLRVVVFAPVLERLDTEDFICLKPIDSNTEYSTSILLIGKKDERVSLNLIVPRLEDSFVLNSCFVQDLNDTTKKFPIPFKPIQTGNNSTIYSLSVPIVQKVESFDVIIDYSYLDNDYSRQKDTKTILKVKRDKSKYTISVSLGLLIPLIFPAFLALVLFFCFLANLGKNKDNNKLIEARAGILIESKGKNSKTHMKWIEAQRKVDLFKIKEEGFDLKDVNKLIPVLTTSKKPDKEWKKRSGDDAIFPFVADTITVEEIETEIRKSQRSNAIDLRIDLLCVYNPNKNTYSVTIGDWGGSTPLLKRNYVTISNENGTTKSDVPDDNTGKGKEKENTSVTVFPPDRDNYENMVLSEVQDSINSIISDVKGLAKAKDTIVEIKEIIDGLNEVNGPIDIIKKSVLETRPALDSIQKEFKEVRKETDGLQALANKLSSDILKEKKETIRKIIEENNTLVRLTETLKELGNEKLQHEQDRNALAITSADLKNADNRKREELKKVEEKFQEELRKQSSLHENQINTLKERHGKEIDSLRLNYEDRLDNWRSDKELFLSSISKPTARLVKMVDDMDNRVERDGQLYKQILDYILSGLKDFNERVCCLSADNSEWGTGKTVEVESNIRSELTGLIKINSSWVNALARFYCYTRIKDIGNLFEENGVCIKYVDSAYRDMVSLFGRLGISIIIPRLLVDYYDDHSKQYFGFNNEDIIITRFASRDLLIRNKESLIIYDMSRIAYYMDGVIIKGEIVHF